MTEEEKCHICSVGRQQHEEAEASGALHHKFATQGESLTFSKQEREKRPLVQSQGLPGGDPVLRMVLYNKGLITAEELEQAEALLKATGVLRSGHADPAGGR
jgi:hypothetical protein